jgi:hypothetical protein
MNLTFAPQIVEVDCREWKLDAGEKIFVKEPTAGEYTLIENIHTRILWDNTKESDIRKSYARIAVICACDASGKKLFSEEQIPTLIQAHHKPLRRIYNAISSLCKLEDSEAETLEKNS